MRARARIHLGALKHNCEQVRKLAPNSRIMAVIKANAYGHGMQQVAQALETADGFAVACLQEALDLRQAGVQKNILVFQGVQTALQYKQASQQHLDLVIHHESQLALLESLSLDKPVNIWLKLDTGMHRLGFDVGLASALIKRLYLSSSVATVRLMSHLANADSPQDDFNIQQLQNFLKQAAETQLELSLANSGGICLSSDYHLNWVRPGIMLYGVNPFTEDTDRCAVELRPVMTLTASLISIQSLKKGDRIGYGGHWQCPEDMPVGVVSIGYGDGYPRHAPSGTPVLIGSQRVPIVGRVSMDMLSVDLRQCPQAAIGDEVTLWGEGLPVEEIAAACDTIAYELTCKITSRVSFSYIES